MLLKKTHLYEKIKSACFSQHYMTVTTGKEYD